MGTKVARLGNHKRTEGTNEAMSRLRRLVAGVSPQRLCFSPVPVRLRFVVEKVALGRGVF